MAAHTPFSLAGRKAVVTGGHAGIGLAIARHLQAAGVQTAVADISSRPVGLPEPVFSFYCDVTQAADVEAFYRQVDQTLGQPDILVCNAGRGIQEKLTEGDPEKWKQVIELNLLGALRMVRAFVPAMLAAGRGDVAFISSVAAGQAFTYGGIYAATKSALQTVAETLRLEVLPAVRVITLAPGVTNTSFFDNTISGFHTVETIGYGALDPDTVAQTLLFALSQPPEVAINHLTIRPGAQPF